MKLLALILLFQPVGMVSKYVSAKEAYGTNRTIPNVPTKEQEAAIKHVAKNFFDPLRERVGSALYISSMFRSPELNKIVGGAKYSDHQVLKDKNGHYTVAIDIDQDGRGKVGNTPLFHIIRTETEFVKLIWEFGDNKHPNWVHVSVSTNPKENKLKRVYRAVKSGKRTVYLNYSTSGLNN